MTTRRKFITKTLTGAAAVTVLPAVNTLAFDDTNSIPPSELPLLRFALASDAHYGEPHTDYKTRFANMIKWINNAQVKHKFDFVIFNGDLVHDQPELLAEVKAEYLDKLVCPYYVVPGNHDHVDTAMWKQLFGYEDNFVTEKRGVGFVFANTTNKKGNITGPDNTFLKQSLDGFTDKKAVFVIMHVPPVRWLETEKYFFDFPETVKLLNSYPNIQAVFCGHDHSLDGKRMIGKVPCFFDSHIGGSWGTSYTGYREVNVWFDFHTSTFQVNAEHTPILNTDRMNVQAK